MTSNSLSAVNVGYSQDLDNCAGPEGKYPDYNQVRSRVRLELIRHHKYDVIRKEEELPALLNKYKERVKEALGTENHLRDFLPQNLSEVKSEDLQELWETPFFIDREDGEYFRRVGLQGDRLRGYELNFHWQEPLYFIVCAQMKHLLSDLDLPQAFWDKYQSWKNLHHQNINQALDIAREEGAKSQPSCGRSGPLIEEINQEAVELAKAIGSDLQRGKVHDILLWFSEYMGGILPLKVPVEGWSEYLADHHNMFSDPITIFLWAIQEVGMDQSHPKIVSNIRTYNTRTH